PPTPPSATRLPYTTLFRSETVMNYALLPFPTFSKEAEYAGRPDIRDALASRDRNVAPKTIDNLELLNHVVDSLRDMPWRFAVDRSEEHTSELQSRFDIVCR